MVTLRSNSLGFVLFSKIDQGIYVVGLNHEVGHGRRLAKLYAVAMALSGQRFTCSSNSAHGVIYLLNGFSAPDDCVEFSSIHESPFGQRINCDQVHTFLNECRPPIATRGPSARFIQADDHWLRTFPRYPSRKLFQLPSAEPLQLAPSQLLSLYQ